RELTLADGTRTRVADLLHTAHGLLITTDTNTGSGSGSGTGTAAGQPAYQLPGRLPDRVDLVTGTWTPAPHPGPDHALDAVLIRPDGYVAWTSPGTTDDLTQALERWFTAQDRP
ncbi:hypothetical protein ACFWBT_42740, partial [Streptomyces sp. NPDC060027]